MDWADLTRKPQRGGGCHDFSCIGQFDRASATRGGLWAAKEIQMNESKSRPRPRKTTVKVAAKKAASKKAAPAKRPRKASLTAPVDREAMVRMAAYLRAARRGFAPGHEVEDWLAAEAEVSGQLQGKPAAKPRKTPARKPRGRVAVGDGKA
jgi:type IV secretory pathway VirB9-like protein